MKSVGIRGSVVAAVASIFVLGSGIIIAPAPAQQAALAANPELAAQGTWDPATTYALDDIVTARGSAWISLRNNNINRVPGQTQPSTAIFWQLFARGFNPTGAWVNTATYQPDDLVTFSGQTFRAKRTVPANRQPAANSFWELFAQKGDPGPNTGIAAGNASTPSISFTSDPDTGIFSPGAGKVALVENGALFLHNIGTGNTALGAGALIANTEANNTAVGTMALNANTTGHDNTAVGSNALIDNSTGLGNTALGALALFANTTGAANTAVGSTALSGMITGASNTAVGSGALLVNNGSNNTAVGASTLAFNNSGTDNIAIGRAAGFSATTSDNGIFIGSLGVSGDTATIRIGTQATQTRAFMAGIRGITTTANDAVAVLVSSTGQLGTVSSSRRYKTDIESMNDVSAMLGKLRPVTFRYKQAQDNGQHPLQYGLIAEEVAETFPDLAVFNTDGSAETVKYHLLPSFLLAGYQAQQTTIAAQEQKIETLTTDLADLKERLRRLEALLPQSRAAALQ